MNDFIKSYETDYTTFKRKFKEAGLGSILEAKSTWNALVGGSLYDKKQALKRLKDSGISLGDMPTLYSLVKSAIITTDEDSNG